MELKPISSSTGNETYLLKLKNMQQNFTCEGKAVSQSSFRKTAVQNKYEGFLVFYVKAQVRSQTAATRLMHLTTQQHAAVQSRAEQSSMAHSDMQL